MARMPTSSGAPPATGRRGGSTWTADPDAPQGLRRDRGPTGARRRPRVPLSEVFGPGGESTGAEEKVTEGACNLRLGVDNGGRWSRRPPEQPAPRQRPGLSKERKS